MENVRALFIRNKFNKIFGLVAVAVLVLSLSGCGLQSDTEEVPDEIPEEIQQLGNEAEEISNDTAAIEDDDKMVSIPVEDLGRADPFLPADEAALTAAVPNEKLKYELLEPLDTPEADEQASKIITTKVSGIMYDNINPSAILNIEDTDYLVRSGDVINGYKILSIGKNNVTIQMGSNIYKAGVGQLVTNGQTDVTYNNVANLNKKFGGTKSEVIK